MPIAGAVLASCSSTESVATWASTSSLSANDAQLETDLSGIARGLALRELTPLHTVCEAFSADAATAYSELPTPNQALTDVLSEAYDDFERSGGACYSAPSFESAKMHQFEAELARGKQALAEATALLRSFGVG